MFFQMVVEVCIFLHCTLEGGSQQVMLEGMLLPLFPVPPLNVDVFRRKHSQENITKPYTQFSLFACRFYALND